MVDSEQWMVKSDERRVESEKNSAWGKEISALDFIFDKLIKEVYKDKEYFDFGVSTEDGKNTLMKG